MTTDQPTFYTKGFENKEELLSFLHKENNSYSKFILEKLERPLSTVNSPFHKHHIQPEHAGGTNDKWNFVILSFEEHAQAHKLLFECYKNSFDKGAYDMMKGNTAEGLEAIRKENHKRMKAKKVGFYNREVQAELAQRPKKQRQAYARNIYVLSALQKGFVLQSTKTNAEVVIQPGECKSLVEVIDKWLSHSEMLEKRSLWLACENKEKFTLYTGFTRMLTGHRDQKTKKAVYSVAGWRIKGLNV